MRNAADKRVLLEVAVIRASRPAMDADLSALTSRMAALERKVAALPAQMAQTPAAPVSPPAPAGKKAAPEVALAPAQWEDLKLLEENWAGILRGLPHQASIPLKDAWIAPREGGVMELVFKDSFSRNMAEKFGTLDQLQKAVAAKYGKSFRFDGRTAGTKEIQPTFVSDSELEAIRMPIDTEE